MGVVLHGAGWSASQPEDLERKTKKGRGGGKKNKYTLRTETSRGAAAVRACSFVSSTSSAEQWKTGTAGTSGLAIGTCLRASKTTGLRHKCMNYKHKATT